MLYDQDEIADIEWMLDAAGVDIHDVDPRRVALAVITLRNANATDSSAEANVGGILFDDYLWYELPGSAFKREQPRKRQTRRVRSIIRPIETFIQSKGGSAPKRDVYYHAEVRFGVTKERVDQSIARHRPRVYNLDHTHFAAAKSRLVPQHQHADLARAALVELAGSDSINVNFLFERIYEHCLSAGIKTGEALFVALSQSGDPRVYTGKYPLVLLHDPSAPGGDAQQSSLLQYLDRIGGIAKMGELYAEFVGSRGFTVTSFNKGVTQLLETGQIFPTLQEGYITATRLGLGDHERTRCLECATQLLDAALDEGLNATPIEHLVETCDNDVALADNQYWTNDICRLVLTQSDEYDLIGADGHWYTDADDGPGSYGTTDLIADLIAQRLEVDPDIHVLELEEELRELLVVGPEGLLDHLSASPLYIVEGSNVRYKN